MREIFLEGFSLAPLLDLGELPNTNKRLKELLERAWDFENIHETSSINCHGFVRYLQTGDLQNNGTPELSSEAVNSVQAAEVEFGFPCVARFLSKPKLSFAQVNYQQILIGLKQRAAQQGWRKTAEYLSSLPEMVTDLLVPPGDALKCVKKELGDFFPAFEGIHFWARYSFDFNLFHSAVIIGQGAEGDLLLVEKDGRLAPTVFPFADHPYLKPSEVMDYKVLFEPF